jgi:predicted nucleotidyltransferase
MRVAWRQQNCFMMKASLDFTNKQELSFLSDLISDMRVKISKIDILLVGAMARDLLLYYAHEIRAARGTEDIDLAFAVASWSDFEELRRSVLSSHAFQPHPSGAHKLLYRNNMVVDLIPFGKLENAEGIITWPPNGDTVMSVLGFEEALESSIEALLPSNRQVAVVSLPMLAVLKILAWSERRAVEPRKDASDLMLILKNYLDAGNSERLYSEASQLLENPGFDYECAGAWLVGRDAKKTIQMYSMRANRIEEKVLSALASEVDPKGPLHFIAELGIPNPERARQLLSAFLAGFNSE